MNSLWNYSIWLCRLMELKQLTRLHLGNQCAEHFTFYEGVAPVLNSCGRTLKTLVLEQFTEMDPAFIGKSCPGLTHLALSCCDTYAPCMIIITILMCACGWTWFTRLYFIRQDIMGVQKLYFQECQEDCVQFPSNVIFWCSWQTCFFTRFVIE